LAGNDDLGQMSAWYAFSAIGFYPMNPVGGEFVLGTPEFEEVSLSFGEQPFVVKRNTIEGNEYVKEVRLNGQLLETPIITYAQLVQGGELEFIMHDK
ncbi:alpha-mannosidase, partial [Pseudomonas sp. HMWF031]